ncbi:MULTISPECIES: hypothetical protein [unclassified Clostridioides]
MSILDGYEVATYKYLIKQEKYDNLKDNMINCSRFCTGYKIYL